MNNQEIERKYMTKYGKTVETMSDVQVKVLKETLYYCLNKLKTVDLLLTNPFKRELEKQTQVELKIISKHVFEMIQELRKVI